MANVNFTNFHPPEKKNAKLWRCMDFSKFYYLVSSKKLFFPRSDSFADPFEGSSPITNIKARQNDEDTPQANLDMISKLSKWFKQWVYITCWHENEHESAMMWRLYTQSNESIAIVTDFQTLADVLPDKFILGRVNYIDYETEQFPQDNVLNPFIHKRKSFEHENEVRGVMNEIMNKVQEIPNNKKSQEVWPENPLSGMPIDVDLLKLIKSVRVSPTASELFYNLVKDTIKQFGFDFEIKKSNLYSDPIY
jgi:hypothetical protein